MEIINFSDFLFEKEKKKEKDSQTKPDAKAADDEWKKKWDKNWSIPIDPERIKPVVNQLELCVRNCKRSIERINLLFSEADQKKSEKPIGDLNAYVDEITKMRLGGGNGKGVVKDGIIKIAENFWEDWSKDEGNRASLIKSSKGITQEEREEFINKIVLSKDKIDAARKSVDTGDISNAEYIQNIKNYIKDKEGRGIGFEEGMKKVMYETIKEGISDLQSSIDNYIKALDEYTSVYNTFMDNVQKGAIEIIESK